MDFWLLLTLQLMIILSQAGMQDQYQVRRKAMVEEQLKSRGISNQKVIQAFLEVERHLFVPERYRNRAYNDYPLPIGYDQTISQPYIVAYMTEVLDLKPSNKILEIGTGSGYQAAILGEICDSVYSIEIVKPLAERAKDLLDDLGYENVFIRIGDGYQGWKSNAPFDKIIVTCAPNNIPKPLQHQLAEGGKMIIPVGGAYNQSLVLLEKRNGELKKKKKLSVIFVPMVDSLGAKH